MSDDRGSRQATIIFPALPKEFPVDRHVEPQNVTLKAKDGLQFNNQLFLPRNLKPGETTPDGKYTVVEVECLALCDKAPAVQVNEEDFFFLTPDKLDDFLKGLE